jgi:hypothetical protein
LENEIPAKIEHFKFIKENILTDELLDSLMGTNPPSPKQISQIVRNLVALRHYLKIFKNFLGSEEYESIIYLTKTLENSISFFKENRVLTEFSNVPDEVLIDGALSLFKEYV